MTTSTSSEQAAAPPAVEVTPAATAELTSTATIDAAPPRDAARARAAEPTLASRLVVFVLCAAVVLSALAFGTVHPWALAIFQAGAGLVVLLWAADAWAARRLRFSRSLLQLPLAGLFVVGVVQMLPLGGATAPVAGLQSDAARAASLDPYMTRMTLVQLAALAVYFSAALVFIDTPKRLRTVVRVLIIFCALLALFALMQYFLNPEQIYWLRQPRFARPFGPFVNRHHFASYMLLAAGLPLGLLFAGAVRKDLLPLYAFAAVLTGSALVATISRGGLLGLGAEVLFLAGLSAFARRKSARAEGGGAGGHPLLRRAGLQLAFGLALIVGVLAFAGDELLSRTAETITSGNVTSDRTTFWRGAREIIRERPWLGAGLGAFGVAYTRHDPTPGAARLDQAHNDYLQILADAGIVGGLLGLIFLVSLFRQGFARAGSHDKFRRGVAAGALSGCFGVLVHSFFDFPLHLAGIALLFFVLAALATADGRVEEAEAPRRRRRRRHAGETPPRPADSESLKEAVS
jgi:O-antigen ligase